MVSLFDIVAGVAVLLVGYSVGRYLVAAHNNLVEARERVDRTWSNTEVVLQRRYDEVSDLVDITREAAEYEQEVLAEVLVSRERVAAASSPSERAEVEADLRATVERIDRLSQEYPELRAHEHFSALRETVSELEQRLEDRREYYNEAVARYNARLRRFPERLFAALNGYEPREPFEVDRGAREGVDIRERLESR